MARSLRWSSPPPCRCPAARTADTAAVVDGQRDQRDRGPGGRPRRSTRPARHRRPLDTAERRRAPLIAAPIINEVASKVRQGPSPTPRPAPPCPTIRDPLPGDASTWSRPASPCRSSPTRQKQQVLEQLKKADITINPRYGTLRPQDTASLRGAQLDQAATGSSLRHSRRAEPGGGGPTDPAGRQPPRSPRGCSPAPPGSPWARPASVLARDADEPLAAAVTEAGMPVRPRSATCAHPSWRAPSSAGQPSGRWSGWALPTATPA